MRISARLLVAVAFVGTITAAAANAAPAPAVRTTATPTWQPQAAAYGEGSQLDQPVVASDGTVLRANVYYPTSGTPAQPASGPFPVLLQQTPYGKSNIGNAAAIANTDIPYLVDRGYIVVLADVRGTGDSGGSWGLFDPVQATDGATLVRWAAKLPHSDGKVGLFGESYMGINQFLTVGALPSSSPVKAMFPIIAGNDLYRDTVTQGGILDGEFSAAYLALLVGLDTANPLENANANLATIEAQHAGSLTAYDLPTLASFETGGSEAYDGVYWAQRSPVNVLQRIVNDHIPAFLIGGWNDLFQRGELLNYTGLQNAAAGRPVLAPMAATQAVTPRYQLMMGPWEHVTTGQGVDVPRLELEWFDTWLLGHDTPMAHTATPLHLYDLNAHTWDDAASWPLSSAAATRYYLSGTRSGGSALSDNNGSLVTAPPSVTGGSDPLVWDGLSSVCDVQSDQWAAGALALGASSLGTTFPCNTNDVTLGTGPGALTYTSAPASHPEELAGPIDATLYATATTTDTELVTTIEEVSPSGQSVPLTSGALLGSLRALDPSRSWIGSDGSPLLPYHPYTPASQHPVVPGAVTRYDIEVFPTFAQVPAGWRLRVTITTADTPHLLVSATQVPALAGGVYQVSHAAGAASFINLPLVPVAAVSTPCGEICANP